MPPSARDPNPAPADGGAIAQLGERLNGIQEVRGSTPLGSTTPLPGRTARMDATFLASVAGNG